MNRKHKPKIAKNIVELIGNTPLVSLEQISKNLPGNIVAKLEYFNPMSSVKDRIGAEMIESAEISGVLKKGMTIIEPTSGNTGIALAFVAASKGYELIITMPDTMSIERQKIMKALGAKIILTPGADGMKGAIAKATKITESSSNYYMPQQFNNLTNPEAHRKTTAIEIWEDTDGQVDLLVSAVGTGGTITGIASTLKKVKSSLKAVAVEPEGSAVLSGEPSGFIPKTLDMGVIDEVIKVSDDDSKKYVHLLAKEEGILAGISSGAALCAAIKLAAREENKDKMIVVILASCGERYLSTWLYDDI
ncbi:UNVERIFIED_CONTAM: hypothetical protein GTU68_039001 [Idotea baltica]|nr:hypothetical protein [Idotea baltica]